jgi:hypothetical protein
MGFKLADLLDKAPYVPGCTGKVRWETKARAEWALDSLLRRPTVKDARLLNVYQCGDHWHVGRRRRSG